MAIFPGLPGVQVTIRMNGVAMKEYHDSENEVKPENELSQYQWGKTVSNFIESITDEEFSIVPSVKHPYKFDCEGLCFDIYVDGRKVRSPILNRDDYITARGWQVSIQGINSRDNSGDWKIQKFKFAAIETTTDDDKIHDIKEDAARVKEAGEIAIRVFRQSDIQPKGFMSNYASFNVRYENAIHEKALKGQAKSHGTALGEVQASKAVSKVTSKRMDGEGRPIAIYKFKYRSREALQSLLIVSREPDVDRRSNPTPNNAFRPYTPEIPDPKPINLENITPEESVLMAAYLTRLRGTDSGSDSPSVKTEKGIKREGSAVGAPRKKVKQEGVVVVDLTDD